MGITENLIWLVLALSYLVPWVFIKTRKNIGIKTLLKESEQYQDLENYIQIKKYEFERYEKLAIFLIGICITLLLAFKITNFGGAIAYLILGIVFILSLSCLINLDSFNREIIKKLYQQKDAKMKRRSK